MDPVSARLLNQQMICPRFTSPHDGWGLCSGDLYALKQSYARFVLLDCVTGYRSQYQEGACEADEGTAAGMGAYHLILREGFLIFSLSS